MLIEIEIPDSLPEGRRSSFKKGIADALIAAATTETDLKYTPEGHEKYRQQGEEVGRKLNEKIQQSYKK